jgi:hypothetical protein
MKRRLAVLVVGLASLLALVGAASVSARSVATLPTGYYQCYQTTSTVWAPTGVRTYATSFAKSFTLFRNHTYNVFAEGLFNRDNHWKFSRGRLTFSSGPMWSGFRHAIGQYRKAGVVMPHSTLHPARRYALVLHDARFGDSDALPRTETADATFWYCKR